MNRLVWVKSSYSGGSGGNCIEVAGQSESERVMVRDTKDRRGAVLRFTPAAWRRFADQVKADRSLANRWSTPAIRHSRVFECPFAALHAAVSASVGCGL